MTKQTADLTAILSRIKGAPILSIGDVMLDRFVQGSVNRISPEAPVPVLLSGREDSMLGGAGNVARNLAALGASVRFLAVVGDDPAGREVSTLLSAEGDIDPALIVEPGRKTTIKTRFFAASQQLLRVDQESSAAISDAARAELLEIARNFMQDAAAMIISDYGKGVLSPDTLRALIDLAEEKGKPVVIDPKGVDYSVYRGAAIVTPNRRELCDAAGTEAEGDEEIVRAARKIIEACGVRNILATRSKDGMTLVKGDGEARHFPTEALEVFDVSGAGDTVAATLCAALAAGASLEDATRLSNVAAGVVVGKVGTAVARAEEVVNALLRRETAQTEAKIESLDAVAEQVEAQRRRGKKIGFANGCFDLIHPGHVSLLTQARANCDFLVVGLNSDSSVQRLKGPERPVQNQIARSVVLSSMAPVDLVVVFDEDTPLETIRRLKPDVLIKGADYTEDQVVGGDLVKGWGGRVFLAALIEGQSTTATIGRMRNG